MYANLLHGPNAYAKFVFGMKRTHQQATAPSAFSEGMKSMIQNKNERNVNITWFGFYLTS